MTDDRGLPALKDDSTAAWLTGEFGLTLKQARFVQEYVACGFNGAEAARRAGYSKKTARVTASENRTQPNARAVFAPCIERMFEKAGQDAGSMVGSRLPARLGTGVI